MKSSKSLKVKRFILFMLASILCLFVAQTGAGFLNPKPYYAGGELTTSVSGNLHYYGDDGQSLPLGEGEGVGADANHEALPPEPVEYVLTRTEVEDGVYNMSFLPLQDLVVVPGMEVAYANEDGDFVFPGEPDDLGGVNDIPGNPGITTIMHSLGNYQYQIRFGNWDANKWDVTSMKVTTTVPAPETYTYRMSKYDSVAPVRPSATYGQYFSYTTSQSQNIEAFNEELLKTDNASSYSVTNVLENVTNTNTDIVVDKGASYVATLTLADSSYSIREISVMMGGADVTEEVYDSETLTINIPSAFGDIVITAKASNVSIDSLAYKSLTYRDIFMTGNQFSELDFENGLPSYLTATAGNPEITDEDYCSSSHSIKCFGTASQQYTVKKDITVSAGTTFFSAMKVKCTRFSKGKLGAQIGDLFSGMTIAKVTDGWETLSYYRKASSDNNVTSGFLGSMNSANLDGYVDDVVFINIDEVFGEAVPEATIKELYETYIELRKAGV